MATYRPDQHGYHDEDLIDAATLAKIIGVSAVSISKVVNGKSGRLDIYLNAAGKKRFHPRESPQQWVARRASNMVQSPNQAQKAAGMDGLAAQAIAHTGVTNPGAQPKRRGRPPEGRTTIDQEAENLATARADRERFNARLQELKVREKEGELVDKATFYQKANVLMAGIKDQLNGLPPQIEPGIVAHLEECLTSFGMTDEQAREIITKGAISHVVREAIRQGIMRSMRELATKPVEELLGA